MTATPDSAIRTPEEIAEEIVQAFIDLDPEWWTQNGEVRAMYGYYSQKLFPLITTAIRAEREQRLVPSKSLEEWGEQYLDGDWATKGNWDQMKDAYAAGSEAERARIREALPSEDEIYKESRASVKRVIFLNIPTQEIMEMCFEEGSKWLRDRIGIGEGEGTK